ncbi:competence protein ComGB [Lysinibacillus parviboronicapiens]|uniref:Competence protein ComGB n=1 Tax=Lysinibacillus parviboronicapiens TaxID=436516 RepID=A0ABV2PHT4_9BACI
MHLRVLIEKLQMDYNRATKWRVKEQANFFNRLSVLIQEGYLFTQAISMLLPHHIDAHEEIQLMIEDKFKEGVGVTGILETLQISKHYLVAISIAENNGHMIEAFKGVAKQMALNEATKKKFKGLLLYPLVLMLFLLLLFLVFRTIFFPNIEKMVLSRSSETGETSIAFSRYLLHLPDVLLTIGIVAVLGSIILQFWLKRQPIAQQLYMSLKIPFMNIFIRLSMTRQFAAYLGSLLQSGFSLQASLHILEKQQLQPFIRYFAGCIKERVIYGDTLTQAVQLMAEWQKDFSIFVQHGEQSGYLGKELVLYSELLAEKQELFLKRMLAFVQPTLFLIIALCIVAAYVSLLLPIYHMIELV